MFQVQILDSDGLLVHHISLADRALTVGRDESCDVCLADGSVSRSHAVLEPRGKFHFVRDVGSTNGTWVNRNPVKEQMLRAGDTIHIGSFRLAIRSWSDCGEHVTVRISDPGAEIEQATRDDRTVRLDMKVELAQVLATQEFLDRMVRLQQISQELGLIEAPESLRHKVLRILINDLGADRACILERRADGGLHPVVARMASGDDGTIDIRRAIVETVREERTAVLAGPPERSVMCAPLMANDELLGALYVDRGPREKEFAEQDLRVLAVLANQVAISTTNSRLFQDVLAEKRKVQAVLEHLSEGLVITNRRLEVERYNESASRIFSQRNNYLFDKNLLEVLDDRCDEFDRNAVLESVDSSGSFQISLEVREETRIFTVTVSSYPGPDGRQVGYVFSFKDMTDFSNLGVLKSEFIRVASHKLRTPLTVLMGNLELLRSSRHRQDEDPEDADRKATGPGSRASSSEDYPSDDAIMAGVERNLRQLQMLVNRFVEFVELDQIEAAIEDVSLDEAISIAWAGLADEAEVRGIRLSKDPGLVEADIRVRGVLERLSQCFSNILENAIKFSPDDGEIRIDVHETESGETELSITDSGPGIPEDHLPYVFCGFHQVEKISTGEAPGVGLGLTIARRILHLHGANVAVDNRADSGDATGTVVKVIFPAEKPTAPTTRAVEAEAMAMV